MVLIRPDSEADKHRPYHNKTPKRVLHFSDGTLEEYSTDDEEVDSPHKEVVDPRTLSWGPWMVYKTWAAGETTLSVIDYIGESLASLFGITTPKYYFELEEYKRQQEQEKKIEELQKGWSEPADSVINIPLETVATSQPKPVNV
ncbi:protein FAM177A1 [Cylas formicarius]|uniref:protein FAM177A1 n=1 Tax=Cylas formicarius TaxID=197179 RepID=UPI002958D3D4|nr:protein FAM177A1 [Cylas formicarius]